MPLEAMTESAADAAEATAVENGTAPAPEPSPAPEPAPAEPKAAEPAKAAAEPAKPGEPAKPPEKQPFVSHAALHEARLEAKALREQLAALQAGKPAEPATPTEIDPDTDPIGALKENTRVLAEIRAVNEQQRQLQEFDNRVKAHESEWSAANPDYGERIAFLQDIRARQLAAVPGATREQIGAQLQHDARHIAWVAFQNGKNPGEVFSDLAEVSGWKPKAAADPAPPPAPTPEPPVDLEAKRAESNAALDRISRGQRASRATAGAGGNAPEPEMTLQALSELRGQAFDDAMDKHGKRLFGG